MEKKNNSSKLAALAKLRSMVEEMTNEDFKSNKMPKLMALKVTKVDAKPLEEVAMEEPKEESMDLDMNNPMEDSQETCPMCGGSGKCGPTAEKMEVEPSTEAPSDNVSKLKQLLGK